MAEDKLEQAEIRAEQAEKWVWDLPYKHIHQHTRPPLHTSAILLDSWRLTTTVGCCIFFLLTSNSLVVFVNLVFMSVSAPPVCLWTTCLSLQHLSVCGPSVRLWTTRLSLFRLQHCGEVGGAVEIFWPISEELPGSWRQGTVRLLTAKRGSSSTSSSWPPESFSVEVSLQLLLLLLLLQQQLHDKRTPTQTHTHTCNSGDRIAPLTSVPFDLWSAVSVGCWRRNWEQFSLVQSLWRPRLTR